MPADPSSSWMRQRCCYALAASAHQRRKLIAQLHHLQNHSFESPDFREQDTTGRWLNVKVLRPFLITYWLDGSVNELRIVDVQHPR